MNPIAEPITEPITKMSQLGKSFALRLLKAYQWAISPLLPPACRYVPTCSEYAVEAVDRYGLVRGSLLAVGRVLRCHPFSGGGYDPVMKIHPVQMNSESSPGSGHGAVRGNT